MTLLYTWRIYNGYVFRALMIKFVIRKIEICDSTKSHRVRLGESSFNFFPLPLYARYISSRENLSGAWKVYSRLFCHISRLRGKEKFLKRRDAARKKMKEMRLLSSKLMLSSRIAANTPLLQPFWSIKTKSHRQWALWGRQDIAIDACCISQVSRTFTTSIECDERQNWAHEINSRLQKVLHVKVYHI